jgi:exonuclease SbcC
LRKLRREASQENANRKLEAIAQAEALAASDDRAEAMRAAKELQRQWKEIGPSNHKDDQNYWRAFRAACDSIFTRETGDSAEGRPRRENAANRNSKTAHVNIDIAKVSAELDALLSSLESLLALDDEEFRQAREQYQDQSQQFSAALSPKLGNRGKIYTERFTTLKRRFDTRYKALPDKRQQQRIAAVSALTDKLDAFEASLLSAKDADEFATAKAAFDSEDWKALTRPDDDSFTAILDARLASLLKATKAADLDKLSSEAAISAARLCTELEISANVDTPSADQALRMQLQLEQLKAVFGQAKRSAADVIKHSRDEQLRLQCLGPLSPEKRKELRERFEVAAAKLNRG